MSLLAIVLFVLCCLVTLVWSSRHLMISYERRHGFLLSEKYPGPPANPPMLSVVVAAKDEELVIERCVKTMLDQDYPNFEMLVCNDRSADATGRIVADMARLDERLRLVDIEHLPEGWCGKNNAMQNGVAKARGQWICMIDADCWQTSRRTLSTAVQYAMDTEADLLSVLPTLAMNGFWENVIQPVCSGVMMIWFNPDKVNNPAKRNAYANGAFMLVKRSAYDAIGTHEAVKACVNEDMHIADRIKKAGLRLRVVRNDGLYMVRMYTSLRQILRGWGRIFFGTFGTLRRLMISLAVLVTMGLLPYIAAAVGLGVAAGGGAGWWLACGVAGAVAAAMQVSVIFRFYKLIGGRPWLAWTYPIGCFMGMLAIGNSLSKLRKGAKLTWRGTSYTSK